MFDHADVPFQKVREWAKELMEAGEVHSVWTPRGVLYALKSEVPNYASVYAGKPRLGTDEDKAIRALKQRPQGSKDLEKTLGVPREKVASVLKKLERGYLVERVGVEEVIYSPRAVEKVDFEHALDRVLTRVLDVHGPMTAHELAYHLDAETELVEETLRDLENEGIVSSGNFVVGEEYQVMLSRDLSKLQAHGESRKVIDETKVKAFRMKKQLSPLRSIDDFFETFLESGMVYDIYNHVAGFSFDDWLDLRRRGKIIEGRFLRGRVRYVRTEDAPLFLSAYPREPLTEYEEEILEVIRKGKGVDLDTIVRKIGGDRERIREAVHKLDSNVYVIRRFNGEDGWTARNYYEPFECGEVVEDAREKLVLKVLKAHGPVPLAGIRDYTRFHWEELSVIVERLEERGEVERIVVAGAGEQEMYALKADIAAMESNSLRSTPQPATVLSLYDPWLQSLWAQIASKWGEGWIYLLVKDGDLIGMVEAWEMSGCVEIREIDVDGEERLPDALAALDRMMGFYHQRGIDVMRVTRAMRKDVTELDSLDAFKRAGYRPIGDFLAKGDIVPATFEKEQVLAYILTRQGIGAAARFETPVEAVKAVCGLRSDLAARLRTASFEPLERLHRHGSLSRGIGISGYWTYCTEEQLRLWKKARDARLTAPMKKVLAVIREKQPVSRSKLIELSPFTMHETSEALRKLHTGSYVTRDASNRYRTINDSDLSVKEARKETLRQMFRAYGVITAENVSIMTRFAFTMAETRRLLRQLESDGFLVKGFFVKGDRRLHWALKDDVDAISNATFDTQFVLTPLDDLALFLREDVMRQWRVGSCYVVFDGTRMVGSFKARKRGAKLAIISFEGEDLAKDILEKFEEENELIAGEQEHRITDEEILRWFEAMYSKGSSK